MIELPNNKISRNLPEQVGFNSAKIAEIIKWINDSDFLDKVIDLSDPSGTLSSAQYEIADLSPSYIVYGGKVFVKSLEDSSNIDFFKVGTDMSGSGSIVASVERVRVVKATKAYQYETVQLFESYNKTQLDTLLGAKADLSGAIFTGAVSAATLEQSQPNWQINNIFDSIDLPAGLTYEKKYARFEEINGMVFIVHIYTITNPTNDAINYNTLTTIDIPQEIAEKIYDFDGKTVAESGNGNITSDICFYGTGNELYNQRVFTIRNSGTENRLQYLGVSAISIPANTTMKLSFRTFLTIL